jgi:hypothetical protein
MFRVFFLYLSTVFFFCNCYSEELGKRGFFADAAMLYWQASEGGLGYAVESSSLHQLAPHAEVETPEFEWDFGFKLGLGYRFPHDRWEFIVAFTSFQTHTDNHKKVHGGNVLFPLWQRSVAGGPFFAEEIKVHWRLHLGIIDLMLSKSYLLTKNLSLTPQVSLRAGSFRQKYNLGYSGGSFSLSGNVLVNMKNKYFGIGPHAGLLGEYLINRNLSAFAKSSFSLLAGEFYIHQDEYSKNGKEKIVGVRDIFPATAAVCDSCAGMRWQRSFCRTLKRLQLELAWDQLLFFSQNQLMRFASAHQQGIFFSNQGDLTVYGIQFNMRFDF